MDIEKQFHEFKKKVEEVGTIAYTYFNSADTSNTQKEDGSVVTEIDTQIEQTLISYIRQHFPNDTIVGEEYGTQQGTSGFVWHIDPIDGTDNFLRRIPFFAISVARLGDTPEDSFGIIYNPATKQMFSSFLEDVGGMYENERLTSLRPEPTGGRYFIAVGAGKREPWMATARYGIMKELRTKTTKGVSYDCSALELAYVAANRIDAVLSFGLSTYDYAAGLFITKAAGATLSVFENGAWRPWTQNLKEFCAVQGRTFFVSHPDVHAQLLAQIGDPSQWA
jgi:myo-inositol-1(or 4)-monophosphatase